MREPLKTAAFLAAALLLAGLAALTRPERARPEIFSDQGQPFYPRFTDPQAARAIEVMDYDEATATARPLKIEFRRGRWVVASHHNYPVEAGDRLARNAAGLADLRKDMVRSDSPLDHAQLGVIDPLDPSVATLSGRGKRITLRDARGEVLADYIFGKPVEGKPGYRYVRVPGQKRTYAVKTEADPSARLADWADADLLRIAGSSIRRIVLQNYAIDETFGRVVRSETITLSRQDGGWSAGGEKLDPGAISALVNALDSLRLVDVRPKPPSLAADLRQGQVRLSLESALSLRQYGFFLTQQGRLLAKEGEMTVETADGLAYTLRFGEVAAGGGDLRASGAPGENRYLFVTVSYDAGRAARYGGDGAAGERRARELNQRFADWYYVISGADFRRLRLRPKEAPAGASSQHQPPA
jgi:hypothetical protein